MSPSTLSPPPAPRKPGSSTITLSYANPFVESLLVLDNGVRTRLKKVLGLLKADPFSPALRTHPVKRARQEGMLSARVTDDFRLIFLLGRDLAFLLYVDHHDEAYRFAERTVVYWSEQDGVRVETAHVEEAERVQDEVSVGGPFARWTDAQLAASGVPRALCGMIRALASVSALREARAELGDLITDRLLSLLGESTSEPLPADEPERVDTSALHDDALIHIGIHDAEARRAIQAARTVDELFWTLERHGLATDKRASQVLELLCGPPSRVDSDLKREAEAGRESPFETLDDIEDFDDLIDAVKVRHRQFRTWQLYLTRSQRALVERSYEKPVRISGPPGTGKTVLAIHRAHWLTKLAEQEGRLAKEPNARVHVVVFNRPLQAAIASQIGQLTQGTPRFHHLQVSTLHELASEIAGRQARATDVKQAWAAAWQGWRQAATPALESLGSSYLQEEVLQLIKGRGISSLEEYLEVERRGRVMRLSRKDREAVWELYTRYAAELEKRGTPDYDDLVNLALERVDAWKETHPVLGVVSDEIQDLSPQGLRLLARLAGEGPNRLFLTGDACQSIYQHSFSLAEVGIDVSGTGRRLRVNYRNGRRIWRAALSILEGTPYEDWLGTKGDLSSVQARGFDGEVTLTPCDGREDEQAACVRAIAELVKDGVAPRDIAVLVRTNRYSQGLGDRFEAVDIPIRQAYQRTNAVCVGTMHVTKGMEFRHVFVLGVGDEEMPYLHHAPREESERARVVEAERRLLFTAMTRARDGLHLSWSGEPSRFLGKLLESEAR